MGDDKDKSKVGDDDKTSKPQAPPEHHPMTANAHLVKDDVANLEGRKLLQENIEKLNGVSKQAATVLKGCLKVNSIFDLAMSHYFNSARSLVDAGSPLEAAFLQHNFIPGDAFNGDPHTVKLNELKNGDISQLNFPDTSIAQALKSALQIETIRDMALWPPFQNARQILLSTFDPMGLTHRGEDPEAPADLIPACGNFPTECVYYTSVFLDEIHAPGKKLIDLGNMDNSGCVSLFSEGTVQGFERPAKGGILTYKQSWYAQGVTLGQLLHSLALAPGESTRIAMVDWYRRTGEKTEEAIAESDVLSQTTQQSRSISEITRAVATEMQHGGNRTSVDSQSRQFGGAGGFGLLFQASGGSSRNSSISTSVSSSFGQRRMAADMNQQILSSTQQNATAERSRRATIVRECYQEEKETLTTRAVTNYNHMHALTVQYYEVVQVYRVKTEIWKAERVLFIPMERINFGDPRVFTRYKEVLKKVAIDNDIRSKLDALKSSFINLTFASEAVERIYHSPKYQTFSPKLQSVEYYDSAIDVAKIKLIKVDSKAPPLVYEKDKLGENRKRVRLEKLDLNLSELQKIDFEFDKSANQTSRCRLKYEFTDSNGQLLTLEDTFTLTGNPPATVSTTTTEPKQYTFSPVVVMKAEYVPQLDNAAAIDLIQHLKENLHYSHAIWLSLDPLTLSQMLAGYTYDPDTKPPASQIGDADKPFATQIKPLASQIDPRPVAITGNYLGFRWSFGSKEEEEKWLIDHKLYSLAQKSSESKEEEEEWQENVKEYCQPVEVDIPLPSGGVFAEAVLGRFNSAEKLDITRYWNWQDSPIPFTASDIAALTAGGKSEKSDLTPGQLGQPAVTINAAPTLPDPTGMHDMMQAIAASNMFRDMSNQAATAALAGQGIDTANKGASNAAQQASENYRTYVKAVSDVAKEVIPLIATKGLSGASISKVGAAANLASKIDEKESTSTDGDGTGSQQTVLSSLLGVVAKSVEKKETTK